VERVREAVRGTFQLANAELVRTRVILVLWGTPFHPSTGKSTKLFQTRLVALNAQSADKNLSFASFSVDELLYDATDHEDVARVEIVTDRAAHPRLRHTKDFQLPYIRVSDPQARIRDLRVGQIIKVHRQDFALGGESVDYRVVVPDDA
jgi:DNA-directed RNA polymerase subunit H (RpoH/RPB5)